MKERDETRRLFDEPRIIELLWKILGRSSGSDSAGEDPFDDDVSWHGRFRGKLLLAKCDMLVSSTDAPLGMSASQMGMKAITSCVSDFAAKGARPRFCLISIALPRNLANPRFVTDLALGLRKGSDRYRVRILAGDTNASSSDAIIDCAMFGFADRIVKRSGAKTGNIVGVSGRFGLQPSGLMILQGTAKTKDKRFEAASVNSVLNPIAKPELGQRIARFLTSGTDSSDGLAMSLHHLAEAGHVDIDLFSLPIADGVESFAKENSRKASDLVLFGGEEYEIVCTYPESSAAKLEAMGMISIGRVVSKSGSDASVVSLKGKKIKKEGWTHFSSLI